MSLINFDTSARERPELAAAWEALKAWVARHPKTLFIDLYRLGRELPKVDATQLMRALHFLEEKGAVRNAIRLKGPEGVLLDGDYQDVEQVPELVWDRSHTHKVRRDDCEVIFGFQVGEAGGRT